MDNNIILEDINKLINLTTLQENKIDTSNISLPPSLIVSNFLDIKKNLSQFFSVKTGFLGAVFGSNTRKGPLATEYDNQIDDLKDYYWEVGVDFVDDVIDEYRDMYKKCVKETSEDDAVGKGSCYLSYLINTFAINIFALTFILDALDMDKFDKEKTLNKLINTKYKTKDGYREDVIEFFQKQTRILYNIFTDAVQQSVGSDKKAMTKIHTTIDKAMVKMLESGEFDISIPV